MQINFIYNQEELYNESHTSDSSLSIYHSLSERYNIKLLNEEDITNKNEKYILIYPLQGHISIKIQTGNFSLSDNILEKIKNGFDIEIFFCIEAECEFEKCYEILNDYLTKTQIDSTNFYIASGNSKLENIEQYGIKSIKSFNPIINRVSSTMNMHKPLEAMEYSCDKKYLFQCHNNFAKHHRIALLTLLQKNNLLDKVDWSLMRSNDVYKTGENGIDNLSFILPNSSIPSLKESFLFILNQGNPKYSEYEGEYIRNPLAQGEPDHNITYIENPHQHAYINIVNESQFELKNTIHITEKSLIPFHFQQLPIFVATQGHVKKLKELYGFDVFDDIIDHSYDLIHDTTDRMLAIISEIERLNKNESFIKEFYKSNKKRFDKNTKIVEYLGSVYPYDCIIDEFLK